MSSEPNRRHRPGLPARLGASLLLALAQPASIAAPASESQDPNALPRLGDSISGVVSLEREQRLGQLFQRSIRAQLPLHADAQLLEFAEHLSYELALHSQLSDRRLHVNMIDSPQLNAFAAPGGVVGINLGLFLYAETVHEFASVLTHELAHLSQRHYARDVEAQQRNSIPYMLAILASAALLAAGGGDAGMAALTSTQALALQNQLRHSRDREREADRIGITNLAAAGFDPAGMGAMFERMQRAFRYTNRPPEFLLTHPVTQSRIADARNQTADLDTSGRPDRLEYQLMRARVRLHFAQSPVAAADTFRAELTRSTGLHEQALRYGLALALGRNGDTEGALAELDALAPEHQQRIWFQLGRAEILYQGERFEAALAVLERELEINLGNLPLSMLYAKVLNRERRHQQAQQVLEDLVRAHPDNAVVWHDLAETAGLAGDIQQVHMARAEYFQLHGALSQAMEHYQHALALVDDYTVRARIQQRMADVRALRLEAS